MALDDQMNMFQEENNDMGLMQEGGDIDPVSGNEVPPGGTQEGVRDDVEANVSKGEMVIPEDVVRYFGVDHFMQLRDEAKMGYKKMAAMGQMGNPDEASIPDDAMFNPGGMPFSVIDMEYVDEEEQGEPQFPVGGLVNTNSVNPSTQGVIPNTSFLQPAQTQTVNTVDPVTGQPTTSVQPTVTPANIGQITTPTTFTASTLAGVNPTATATNLPVAGTQSPGALPQLPSFGTTSAGTTSINFFRNSGGEVIQIPVLNGRQIFDEPEGFQRFDPDNPAANPFDSTRGAGGEGGAGPGTVTRREPQEDLGGLSGDEVGPDTGPADNIDPKSPLGQLLSLFASPEDINTATVQAGTAQEALDLGLQIAEETPDFGFAGEGGFGIEASSGGPQSTSTGGTEQGQMGGGPQSGIDAVGPQGTAGSGSGVGGFGGEAEATAVGAGQSGVGGFGGEAEATAVGAPDQGGIGESAGDGDGDGSGSGTHICTATYNAGLITTPHFKSLKRYGIGLRRDDPYLMQGYDIVAPKWAKLVGKNKTVTYFAKFLTKYYNDIENKKELNYKQKVFSVGSKYSIRALLRGIGWISGLRK